LNLSCLHIFIKFRLALPKSSLLKLLILQRCICHGILPNPTIGTESLPTTSSILHHSICQPQRVSHNTVQHCPVTYPIFTHTTPTSSQCWLLPLVQVHIVKPTHLQHLKLVGSYKLYFYSIAKCWLYRHRK